MFNELRGFCNWPHITWHQPDVSAVFTDCRTRFSGELFPCACRVDFNTGKGAKSMQGCAGWIPQRRFALFHEEAFGSGSTRRVLGPHSRLCAPIFAAFCGFWRGKLLCGNDFAQRTRNLCPALGKSPISSTTVARLPLLHSRTGACLSFLPARAPSAPHSRRHTAVLDCTSNVFACAVSSGVYAAFCAQFSCGCVCPCDH